MTCFDAITDSSKGNTPESCILIVEVGTVLDLTGSGRNICHFRHTRESLLGCSAGRLFCSSNLEAIDDHEYYDCVSRLEDIVGD